MNNCTRLILTASAMTAAVSNAVSAADENPTAWKVSAGVNLAVAKGNSDSLLFGANILGSKKWDKNELALGADAVYGDSSTTELFTTGRTAPNGAPEVTTRDISKTTAQNYGASAQYNRLVTDKFYFYGNVSARQDRIADVSYRISISPGAGYYFIKNEKTTLSAEAGPGIVFEKLGGVSHQYWTLRIAEKATHQISKTARLFQDAEFIPQVDDWSNYVLQGQIGVEADLTSKLSLRVVFQDTYRNEPASIAGTNPIAFREKNDMKLLAGINYKFQ